MLLLIAFEAFSYSPICIALLEASVAFVTAELTAMHMTMTIIPSSIAIAIVYYGKNVPLFRRNGYRKPGAMIP